MSCRFAKGPLFFLSRHVVGRIVSSPAVRSEFTASAAQDSHAFEDAFAGFAVSVAADQPVVYHDQGGTYTEFSPAKGLLLAPSTLILHTPYISTKSGELLRRAHAWAKTHHCEPATWTNPNEACFTNTPLLPQDSLLRGTLCGGAPFRACAADRHANATHMGSGCPKERIEVETAVPMATALSDNCSARVTEIVSQRRTGNCGLTSFGGDDTCNIADVDRGAWQERSSLAHCVQRCCACARCRFVSFSKSNGDCSWFTDCAQARKMPTVRAQTEGKDRYITVEVRPASSILSDYHT